jgi:hypothetical protein
LERDGGSVYWVVGNVSPSNFVAES